jgi:hypothetical protein
MCGRLRVGKDFLHARRLVGAAMCSACLCGSLTAGHNPLRGSGPGQKPAFENAVAHVGCPDRRIDRLCITCCSPSQPSHHARVLGAISLDPQRGRIVVPRARTKPNHSRLSSRAASFWRNAAITAITTTAALPVVCILCSEAPVLRDSISPTSHNLSIAG